MTLVSEKVAEMSIYSEDINYELDTIGGEEA
jgi:hypothetical protein